MGLRLFHNVFFLLGDKLQTVKAEKFIESNNQDLNTDLVKQVFPYAKWALISTIVGRLILILISLKMLKITKIYFYYELMIYTIIFCLP